MRSLSLLTGVAATASAFTLPWTTTTTNSIAPSSRQQNPLGSSSTEEYKCHLPPVLDPSGDGLPAASDLFGSKESLERQVRRHQAIVQVPSVCYDDLGDFETDGRWKPFYELHDVLAETYPVVHKKAKLEKINTFGLLYTFEGSDPSLKPTMLTAHQDVVPVADPSPWEYPPFEAHFDGEWLWGRGSLDDKNSMTALMSVMETLLSSDEGWKPRRTIILAFGFDEECSGYKGALPLGKHLTERYGDNSMAILLDEGGAGMPMLGDTLYALPATSEKGHVDIWLTLRVAGGHSSIPLSHTGIGIMSEIVTALEAHPYEPKLERESPVYTFLACAARHSPDAIPGLADLLDRDDLDALTAYVAADRLSRYLITTSQAVDSIAGGQKINALPEVTKVGVNYRVSRHNSIAQVQHNIVEYIGHIVGKYNLSVSAFEGDETYAAYAAAHPLTEEALGHAEETEEYKGRLILEAEEASEPAPISPIMGQVWDIFSGSIQHTFRADGKVVTTGQLMTGNTDTRHYLNLTPNVYRFIPMKIDTGVNAHTVDEGVSMKGHMEIVSFYYDFIRNFDAADFGENEEVAGEL